MLSYIGFFSIKEIFNFLEQNKEQKIEYFTYLCVLMPIVNKYALKHCQ